MGMPGQTESDVIRSQRVFFASGATRNVAWRREALRRLKQGLIRHEPDLLAALKADLGKTESESYLSEIAPIMMDLNHAIRNVSAWARPRRVPSPVSLFGAKSRIYNEPYGVTLIISPWNYPVLLTFRPLIGTVAAGNCAVVKPSELSPAVSAAVARLIADVFAPEHVACVEGGVETSTALLEQKFDYIFFTGSPRVGKIVYEKATRHLTPVTLELGGKSPCIVAEDADVRLAAKRIVWGKLLNGGQTCVAPDYLLVHRRVKDRLVREIQSCAERTYGPDMLLHERYPRMLNERQFRRLAGYLQGANILCGGRTDESALRIELTLLDQTSWDDPVMQDEIFGPILPVLVYDDLSDVIRLVNARPKPLACYIFSASKQTQERVIRDIPFGGGCVNDTVIHLSSPHLPFGGVGESGIGSYHGKASFDLFSHHKSVLRQTTLFDLPVRYVTDSRMLRWLKKFVTYLT
jgi:aldehyde dehydrogenase (NAD+)